MSHPPLLLNADNFTSPSRTPWGGRKILERYKHHALSSEQRRRHALVGESWELSAGPELPSRCMPDGVPLASLLARDPAGYLGCEAEQGHTSTSLVVKLLDAADDLSVQIHPHDAYRGLAADEAGKPECWYVVEREPGAGLYFGFREGTTPRDVAEALARQADLSRLLQRVPVEPGDFFLVEPGTAHAVGRGVTLVEPQRMVPGKRGVTYRYWDWNRRYDSNGKPSSSGKPRTLHVDDALAVTDWARSCGADLLKRSYLAAGPADPAGPPRVTPLCGPACGDGLPSDALRAVRLHGTGAIGDDAPSAQRTPRWHSLAALTVLDGAVDVLHETGRLRVGRGRTAMIPAAWSGSLALDRAHAVCSSIVCETSASHPR